MNFSLSLKLIFKVCDFKDKDAWTIASALIDWLLQLTVQRESLLSLLEDKIHCNSLRIGIKHRNENHVAPQLCLDMDVPVPRDLSRHLKPVYISGRSPLGC